MAKASFQWVCTYCDASDLAESPEMAKLAVDVHVSLFHGAPREGIPTQGEPEGTVLIQREGGPAATEAAGRPAGGSLDQLPVSSPPSRGSCWRRALRSLIRHGGRR
jgi:hypothetical protein